jgi:uncharacterized protein with NAD-binding domain and iron-sulfur cluster
VIGDGFFAPAESARDRRHPGPVNPSKPIKVAVIGGGCASLAAAFELTRPGHAGRFEVTVYQVGWRLGGKGASGRGPAGRIEEHGLHLWMGFYENAFRLMRECYAELARAPGSCPIVSWRDAFEPAPYVAVAERLGDDLWLPWIASLPRNDGLPGDATGRPGPWTALDYFRQTVALLRSLFESLARQPTLSEGVAGTGRSGATRAENAPVDELRERLTRLLRYGELASLAALLEGVNVFQAFLGAVPAGQDNVATRFLEALGTSARSQLESLAERDQEVRRLWTVIDLTLATLLGMVRFGLITDPRGYDAVDDYDCREWLMLNGASRQSVDSAYMRGLYDLVFAYEDGDPGRPRISAAQALRSMARSFFTYRGSFFWRMQAGMGDIVFAPLYEVLSRRGVRFAFFHRLENVQLSSPSRQDGPLRPHVAALDFDIQAEVRGGGAYRPLRDVGGLPCWPSRPDYDQLVDGEILELEGRDFESFWDPRRVSTRTLRVGEDFDFVVLGVGIGAIPHICKEIIARDARWHAMVDQVKTVATQAFQIWLAPDVRSLGWQGPSVTLSGFVEPFDTWADMRHLIQRESWKHPPGALAYFCNALPEASAPRGRADVAYLQQMKELVRRNAVDFLDRDVRHLWPRAVRSEGGFRWELLVDPAEESDRTRPREDAARFASQFWTANVNPSDRYALSLPGSSAHRISPLDDTYDNLTIAGDWTATGFNAGCVEAAVMSGRLAAHALSKSPPLEDIVGYDHP